MPFVQHRTARGIGGRLDAPFLYTSNALFFLFSWPSHVTTRVSFPTEISELESRLKKEPRRLMYVAWHSDSWLSFPTLLRLPAQLQPSWICNSSWASKMNSRVGSWCGARMFEFELQAEVSPRKQIIPVSYTHLTLPTIYSV